MKLANTIIDAVNSVQQDTGTPDTQTTSIILNSMEDIWIVIDGNVEAVDSRGRVLNDNNTSSKPATDNGRNT
jgi:hypothetical protein